MSIENLEQKLNGELPVTREELIELVDSWGRFSLGQDGTKWITGMDECYDLSRLDTSKITDMSNIFKNSLFDGDISNWDTSKVTSMERMFSNAIEFNQPLNFDISKVTNMESMFSFAEKFNLSDNSKEWFNLNRDIMIALNMSEREKDNLDSFYNNLEILYNNLDKENN